VEPIVGGQKPGRNDPCPCGSGLRWEFCHGSAEKHTRAMKVAKDAYMVEMTRLVVEEVQRKLVVQVPMYGTLIRNLSKGNT